MDNLVALDNILPWALILLYVCHVAGGDEAIVVAGWYPDTGAFPGQAESDTGGRVEPTVKAEVTGTAHSLMLLFLNLNLKVTKSRTVYIPKHLPAKHSILLQRLAFYGFIWYSCPCYPYIVWGHSWQFPVYVLNILVVKRVNRMCPLITVLSLWSGHVSRHQTCPLSHGLPTAYHKYFYPCGHLCCACLEFGMIWHNYIYGTILCPESSLNPGVSY